MLNTIAVKKLVFSDLVLLYSRTIYLVPKSHYSNQPPGIAPSRLMKSEGNWAALYTFAEGERCATKRGLSPLGTRLSIRDCRRDASSAADDEGSLLIK
ncbi:hypothetical protein OUZ56_033941 [Daphnia magna]|uniref:Uncharacterized protein n=1 Tax=Daphnia magna TaxID=35525 RepID=A0ABR0BBC2_9CRUS|nr:hypothetical protein OUZ56_033941 [Daphnia magna]